MIIIVGLNLQVCFYQLLHDGCDLYWEYSNIIKYQYQTFILCRFLIQPLWTKRYLPGSQEAWTLTPDDEFYFHLFRLFYRTDVGKKNTHTGLGGCLMHLVNLREARPTLLTAPWRHRSVFEVIHKHLNQSLVGVLEGFLIGFLQQSVLPVWDGDYIYLPADFLIFFLSNAAHSGSLSFIFS